MDRGESCCHRKFLQNIMVSLMSGKLMSGINCNRIKCHRKSPLTAVTDVNIIFNRLTLTVAAVFKKNCQYGYLFAEHGTSSLNSRILSVIV